jgi:hypothetical protein
MNLRAVGFMLDSTQLVDMEMIRKIEFGIIFVAVLNPKFIPSRLDVGIGDHYLYLKFGVGHFGMDENGDEVENDLNSSKEKENKYGLEDFIEKEDDSSLKRNNKKVKCNADTKGVFIHASVNGGMKAGADPVGGPYQPRHTLRSYNVS